MKLLGKITNAEYGTISDRGFLMGLQLIFSFQDKSFVSDGAKHCINMSDECKWESHEQRMMTIEKEADYIYKLLNEAKCSYVSELVGKPVEVELEGNWFKNFRILTEVL